MQTGKSNKRTELSEEQLERMTQEQDIVDTMIGIFCRGKKHERDKEPLCSDCSSLQQYTKERNERCPFLRSNTKTFCQFCSVHCYSEERRKEIAEVMRYAGPRMLWHRPVVALRHLAEVHRQKKGQR